MACLPFPPVASLSSSQCYLRLAPRQRPLRQQLLLLLLLLLLLEGAAGEWFIA